MKLALWAPVILGLAACTSQQLYNSAAGVRQQECNKMMDRDEQDRCMKAATRTYDEYEQRRKQ